MDSWKNDAHVSRSTKALYEDGQKIWRPDDKWNIYKRRRISEFARRESLPALNSASTILNAGSGGEPYDWMPLSAINIDIFLRQVEKLPLAVVSDARALPFRSNTFDLILCLASVVNYTSAAECFREFHRVLKAGGKLVFDYESSASFEHLGKRYWNRRVTQVNSIYARRNETLWVYSPEFVLDLLLEFGFRICSSESFHIASSLAFRLGLNQDTAASFSNLDRYLAMLNFFADDHIISVEKIA